MLSASYRSARRPLASTLGAMLAVMAVVGCDCKGTQLKGHNAKISISPNPVVVTDAVVGQTKEVVLKVSNVGTNVLTVGKAPYIVDQSGNTVQFAVTNVFTHDCDSGPRDPATLMTFPVESCAEVSLRYLASADGKVSAKLRFESNDPSSPTDVPVEVDALTPHIKACGFDNMNNMLGCSSDGQPLNLSFGTDTVAIGSTATRTVRLISDGTKEVAIPDLVMDGDGDFTVTPSPSDYKGSTLAPGMTEDFVVTFSPLAGGPRSGTMSFRNVSDPKNSPLNVNLVGQGDGPALCFCVGSATEACKPTPQVDFGQVAVGATSGKFLRLASCGTQPLNIQSVTVSNVNGTTAFAATNPPMSLTLAPNAAPVDVPITFTPPSPDHFTGKILIKTPNGSPFITLLGQGIEGGCKLQVSSNTLDFGQVVKGTTASRDYTVANVGNDACVFTKMPAITAGAPLFGLGSFPLQPLQPTRTAKFTVTYTPATASGTDTGALSIYYAGSAAGSAENTLVVNLKGEPTAQATCKLKATPSATSAFGASLNFGQVGINRPKVLPVVFQNVGSATCTLGKAKVAPPLLPLPGNGTGAFTVKTQPPPTLAPGATASVEVQFLPTAEMSYGSPFGMLGIGVPGQGDTLEIQTSDSATFSGQACAGFGTSGTPGCAGWALSGEGVQSTIQVLPGDLDFGEVTLGCRSLEKTVSIYNVGTSDIHIFGFKVDPMPPPDIFIVIAPPASQSQPITIHSGNKIDIQVRYRPSMVGIETGTLYISSDAVPGSTSGGSMANPYVTVSLTGTGTTDSSQTDVFHQLDHPVADVLWVIDMDSNSMADKQQAISTNSKAFINAAIAAGTDFHLGVISNYLGGNEKSSNSGVTIKPGELYNVHAPQAWVSSSDPNPVQEFSENALIGVTGDATGSETGLEAMFRALSDPVINNANKGFLRDEARLIVISISDDDDLSSKSTDFYAAFLQSLKPNSPQDAVFDNVGGDLPNGCTNGVDGDPPNRFAAVAQKTGGKLYSICTGQYDQIAADLSIGSFGGRTHFVLSRPCDPTTLTVTVNNQMLRMNTDYTFDMNRNAIDLKTAPAPGATITASYNALCL